MKVERDFSVPLIAVACTLAAIYTALFLCVLPFDREIMARRDYIVYWATGQQLIHHGNPYDPAALNRIERNAGFQGGKSYYMRNTPWALPLALPLGFFAAQTAALPWCLLMLGLLVVSVRMLWKVLGPPPRSRLDWLGYCFPPALYCVDLGQTSILLLFGLVLFLRLHNSRPFAAGAALWLCALKPHLFLPFVLVLLMWIVVSRSYRILAGALLALGAGAAATACVDPAAWTQYAYYMRTSGITREFTATIGAALRDSINPFAEWLAFLPCILGCIWAAAYFLARRSTWNWIDHGNPLILVSLLVAPFGWIFDHSLAIPAVLFAASRTSSRVLLSILALIFMGIEVEVIHFDLHSAAYLWIAPAWLIWYLIARASATQQRSTIATTELMT